MKWKKVWATEYTVRQEDVDGSDLPLAAMGVLGKQVRVTVEAAVDERRTGWRELLSFGGPEARRIHDAAFPKSPLAPDRNIRITIEEEISGCCEKWRGAYIYAYSTDSSMSSCSLAPTFCPECGKKL